MTSYLRLVLAVTGIVVITALGWGLRSVFQGPQLEVVDLKEMPDSGPAMCPWRDPQHNLKSFFPEAQTYRTELIALSNKRLEILRRLSGRSGLPSNALYVYPAIRGGREIGLVCVRRVAGRFGSIEVVLALGEDRRVRGLSIQRHREPPDTVRLFASQNWRSGFVGKTAASPLHLGKDLPLVPSESEQSAVAVADAVRALLIELDAGWSQRATPHH